MAATQKVTVKKTKTTTTKKRGITAVSGKPRKTRSDKGKKHKKRNSA